jgi:hypothetical protein
MNATIRRALMTAAVVSGLTAPGNSAGQSARGARQGSPPATVGVPGAVNGTPSLAVLGRAVAAVWTTSKDGAANVYIAMSNDGGATFSEPRRVNDVDGDASANNEQPPRVVMSGSGADRTLTVFWSKRNEGPQRARRDAIRMARSVDGGRTFAPARFTHETALSGARGWESLAASADGQVHAVWLDGRDAERKMAETATHSGMPHKGQPPQDVYHSAIAPDGRITEGLIATGVCFCCKTAVAVDARGTVYAAWRHIFPGSMRDIAFAKSTDGGRRFDPIVRVSEDKWELNGCPEDGPTLAVDQAGMIHIAWATVVQEGEPKKALFYATSRDGKTFSARAKLPVAAAVTPGHPQLTLTPDGGAAIVWDEVVDGLRRVSFTRVSRAGVFQPAQILSGDESASNPVIVRSERGLLVAWTSRSSTAKSAGEPSRIAMKRLSIG